jgi:hypothetical protein
MTKAIVVLMVVAVLYCGWHLFLYWDKVKNEQEVARKQEAAAVVIPEQLPGMPPQLEDSLRTAQQEGAAALRNWLKVNGAAIQDPRKAWIELDFCILLARENPSEARRIFAEVKERTPPASPVWPRINQLARTFQ